MRTVVRLLTAVPAAIAFGAEPYEPNAFGGSPIPIGAGARALGMGGAFVAIADDATANTWNPAGMTQLERPEAALTGGYAWRRTGGETLDGVALDHASLVLPFHLGCQQTIGLAWQRQFDFTKSVALAVAETDDSDPFLVTDRRRDDRIEQEGGFATLGLSWALEPVQGLSFGATVFDWRDDHTGASAYEKRFHGRTVTTFEFDPGLAGPEERRTSDLRSDATIAIEDGWSTVLGGWWQATPRLSLGAAVKPRYRLDLVRRESSTTVETDEDLVAATTSTTTARQRRTIRSTLTYPTSVTVGGALRFGDLTTVAIDGTWTRWRDYRMETDARRSAVSPSVEAADYRDGWSARLGIERLVPFERVILVPRAGLLMEESPGITAAASASRPNDAEATMDRYWGATLGLSVFRRDVILDAAVQYRFARDVAGEGAPPHETDDVRTVGARLSLAYLF